MTAKIIPLPMPDPIQAQALAVYQIYPLKVAKPLALRAITKAIKAFGFEFVLERTELYAKLRDGNKDFMPYPASWFNAQRFLDEPETWLPRSNRQHTVFELRTVRDAKEKLAADLKRKHAYEDAFGLNWSDSKAREQYVVLRSEIKKLDLRIAQSV